MTPDFDLRGQVLPTVAFRPNQTKDSLLSSPSYAIGRVLTFAAHNMKLVSAIQTERGGLATATFDVLDRRLHVLLAPPDGRCMLPRKPDRDPYLLGLAVAAFQGLEHGIDMACNELRTARALALLPCGHDNWDVVTVTEEMPYAPARVLALSRGASSAIRHIEAKDALPPTVAMDVYQTTAIDGEPTTVVHLSVRSTVIKPPEIGAMARLRLYHLWQGRPQ